MNKDQILPFVIIAALVIGVRYYYNKKSEEKNTIA
tara:strand:+ start:18216 stop:18320 length:105 start_codon:yes stop_codon:yes gene_type:complete